MKRIILVGALLSLAGCYEQDPFEIKEVSGETYLINKKTGTVALVKDARLVELQKLAISTEKKLTIDTSIDKKLNVNITAKQIEDRLFYKLELSNHLNLDPYSETAEDPEPTVDNMNWLTEALSENKYDQITLQFQDNDGFVLTEHKINLNDNYTNMRGYSGEIESIVYEGSIRANPILFSKISELGFVYSIRSLNAAPKS